jgi:hypothetical protein
LSHIPQAIVLISIIGGVWQHDRLVRILAGDRGTIAGRKSREIKLKSEKIGRRHRINIRAGDQ